MPRNIFKEAIKLNIPYFFTLKQSSITIRSINKCGGGRCERGTARIISKNDLVINPNYKPIQQQKNPR